MSRELTSYELDIGEPTNCDIRSIDSEYIPSVGITDKQIEIGRPTDITNFFVIVDAVMIR